VCKKKKWTGGRLRLSTESKFSVHIFSSCLSTHGWRRPQGFLPQLDEFYFTTAEKETFGQLQMHCSEFHEWLIHLNRKHGGVYRPYTLVPNPRNFSNFLKMWGLRRPWVASWSEWRLLFCDLKLILFVCIPLLAFYATFFRGWVFTKSPLQLLRIAQRSSATPERILTICVMLAWSLYTSTWPPSCRFQTVSTPAHTPLPLFCSLWVSQERGM
jgi:hypothetical protein